MDTKISAALCCYVLSYVEKYGGLEVQKHNSKSENTTTKEKPQRQIKKHNSKLKYTKAN